MLYEVITPQIAVVALSVVCVTMAILPYLNMLLVRLLKEHDYLIDLWQLPEQEEEQLAGIV